MKPHLDRLEERGLVQARRAAGSETTCYRRADAAAVQPQTASD